jgi:N-acetylglutamate synthase-like GNAT family acetyltransferase
MSADFKIRPFHPSDFEKLERVISTNPAFGLTAVRDGQPIGYAGLHFFGGRAWVFFRSNDPSVRNGMFLHRTTRRWLAAAMALGVTNIWAMCDTDMPRAETWLDALGFRPASDDEKDTAIVTVEASISQKAWLHVGR